jgi:hypothetical protein
VIAHGVTGSQAFEAAKTLETRVPAAPNRTARLHD